MFLALWNFVRYSYDVYNTRWNIASIFTSKYLHLVCTEQGPPQHFLIDLIVRDTLWNISNGSTSIVVDLTYSDASYISCSSLGNIDRCERLHSMEIAPNNSTPDNHRFACPRHRIVCQQLYGAILSCLLLTITANLSENLPT